MLKSTNPEQIPIVFLKAGEIHLAESPCLITTVLGSCIAVTMYCPDRRLGAMCHGLLPSRQADTRQRPTQGNDFRYVDSALTHMLQQLDKRGIKRKSLQVKMFGGAEVLTPPINRRLGVPVGQQNIEAARTFLAQVGLRINAGHVGGIQGHKIFFNTFTGEVFLKMIHNDRTENMPK